MLEFKKLPNPDNQFDVSEVSMKLPSEMGLVSILEEFEAFLRACGFMFPGHVEIVVDEKDDNG